jgi:acetate---CoA ligase (ADP-forming)
MERRRELHDLTPLFRPESVVLVGASARSGYAVSLRAKLEKWSGRTGRPVFLVNPSGEVGGMPVFATCRELPVRPDLALVSVAARSVPSAIVDVREAGIPAAIIYASGLTDEDHASVLRTLGEPGAPLVLGSTSLGFIVAADAATRIDVTPLAAGDALLATPSEGPAAIALVSQSGGLAASVVGEIGEGAVGCGIMVHTGLEYDIDLADCIGYITMRDEIRAIGLIAETVRDKAKFRLACDLAHRKGKHIVILRVGRTERGAVAARSHTGVLTGDDRLYSAFFGDCGVLQADDTESMISILRAASVAPRLPEGGVAMVTASGGGAVLMSDLCSIREVDSPRLRENTRDSLTRLLGPKALVENPVDILTATDLDKTFAALDIVAGDPGCGAVLFFVATLDTYPEALAQGFGDLAARTAITVAVAGYGPETHRRLPAYGVISEPHISAALATVVALAQLNEIERTASGSTRPVPGGEHHDLTTDVSSMPDAWLTEDESKGVLESIGLLATKRLIARDAAEAALGASKLGYPVAMKISSRDLVHKHERGGVRLDLRISEDVAAAYRELAEIFAPEANGATVDVLLEEMIPPGPEIFIGGRVDAEFGPVVVVAPGGLDLSEHGKSSVGFAPLDEARARRIVDNCAMPFNDDAAERLASIVSGVSAWVAANSERLEFVDINPLTLSSGNDFTVVDALIRFRKPHLPEGSC